MSVYAYETRIIIILDLLRGQWAKTYFSLTLQIVWGSSFYFWNFMEYPGFARSLLFITCPREKKCLWIKFPFSKVHELSKIGMKSTFHWPPHTGLCKQFRGLRRLHAAYLEVCRCWKEAPWRLPEVQPSQRSQEALCNLLRGLYRWNLQRDDI